MIRRLICRLTNHRPRLLHAGGVCTPSGATVVYTFRCERCGWYTEITEARDRLGRHDPVGTWFEEARR